MQFQDTQYLQAFSHFSPHFKDDKVGKYFTKLFAIKHNLRLQSYVFSLSFTFL